ncbi:hypothetical protein [uncultured Roseibium sp.]|uniref:hypothetical protein n=1 Tax=uncultured Roseibium sp. TaxID=1936171 RepID=UPI00321740D8
MIIDDVTGLPVILKNDELAKRFVALLRAKGGEVVLSHRQIADYLGVSHGAIAGLTARLKRHSYIDVLETTDPKGVRLYRLTVDQLFSEYDRRKAQLKEVPERGRREHA